MLYASEKIINTLSNWDEMQEYCGIIGAEEHWESEEGIKNLLLY